MENQPETIGFKLLNIKTEQFALFEENFIENKPIKLNTNLLFGMNESTHSFVVTTKFTYEILDKPFISIVISCYFEIEKSKWTKLKTEKEIIFPRGFVAHMTMLSVGTARGVLHEKTNNSKFNNFILPTINVASMIPEDVKFKL